MFCRIITDRPLVGRAKLFATARTFHHQPLRRATPRPPLFLPHPQRRRNGTYHDRPFREHLSSEVSSGGLRRNSLTISIFTVLISSAIGATAYGMYMYNELVEKPLSIYPPPVAKQVKAGLYYSSRGDVSKMVSSFKEAVRFAGEAGMHPLSNEVAGLKIECAQLLLKMKDGEFADKAVEVLERVLDENAAGAEYFEKEGRWVDRTEVLKRAILLGYKIGEIYQDLGKDTNAEEAMSWSTQTLLKEVKRREDGHVDESKEGDWFDDVAMSACFEKLAQQYDKTEQYYLATPLYLKAITLISPNSCHAITLMNNLAASLCRQKLPNHAEKVDCAPLLREAQKWAEKALELDSTVTPPLRTDECDRACVAATHTLGEISRMMGDKDTATRRFDEALSLAQGIGMTEGIEAAKEGLQNVKEIQ